MQYEPTMTRQELISFAIDAYFGNVDTKNINATLDCFNDEALFCVQTDFARHSGKRAIRQMFETFFSTYKKIVHRDFVCTVDELNGRISACFTAQLQCISGETTVLKNTNFWRIRDGKFQEVYVYMSGANVLT